MELEDFRGAHAGKEVICIGNGPSLENVSVDFLRSRPSFGLNFIVHHNRFLDGFVPTYWVGLDFGGVEAIRDLPREMPKFTSRREYEEFHIKGIPTENVIPWESEDLKCPRGGLHYGTSLLGAAHLASVLMEAKTVFLVGFDCSRPRKMVRHGYGLTEGPHFYDPDHEGRSTLSWCRSFQKLDRWLRRKGQKIVNLSHPTYCRLLERGFFWEYEHSRLQEHPCRREHTVPGDRH